MLRRGLRWCARWAWFVFLLPGAAIPPPLAAQVSAKQTVIIINWTKTTADTFALNQAPAKIVISLGRETTGSKAHLICGLSYVTAGAQPFPFAIRVAGDTVRSVVGTWRPFCQSP